MAVGASCGDSVDIDHYTITPVQSHPRSIDRGWMDVVFWNENHAIDEWYTTHTCISIQRHKFLRLTTIQLALQCTPTYIRPGLALILALALVLALGPVSSCFLLLYGLFILFPSASYFFPVLPFGTSNP